VVLFQIADVVGHGFVGVVLWRADLLFLDNRDRRVRDGLRRVVVVCHVLCCSLCFLLFLRLFLFFLGRFLGRHFRFLSSFRLKRHSVFKFLVVVLGGLCCFGGVVSGSLLGVVI